MKSPGARFWEKVRFGPGCWEWKAAKNVYGHFYWEGRIENAHRVAWMILKGPIPEGLHILHRCDNPICVRSDHLFLGTFQENMADMVSKRRSHLGEKHGHSRLTEADVIYIRSKYKKHIVTYMDLAEEFNVSYVTIFDVVHRKTWRHVGGDDT